MPIEPPPTRWELPSPESADEREICGVGADLEPGTVLGAYRTGLFPMRLGLDGPVAWWSPDPRGVIPLDGLHVSRSLRRSQRRFELRVNTSFEAVMRACADPDRPHGWIDESFVAAYGALHRLGWAHSIETWRDEELVGGLYGVAIGGFFAGESMFHRATDASKVALLNCVELLQAGDAALFDVQWVTPHLESLGAR
ncbi:MAG: leucyl/phenylalanyl-tRNA--protein transferase, partial [Acidimicrobiia bacterium]